MAVVHAGERGPLRLGAAVGSGLPQATCSPRCADQFFKAHNRSIIRLAPALATWLNLAVAWELALLLLIFYVPFLRNLFETYPLSGWDWLIAVGGATTVMPVLESAKWMARRGWFGPLD